MSRTKLKDIADKIGVSIATVSKVLNGSDEISEATKRKVLHTARLLNYTPNQIALNLKKQQTKKLGVIIPTTAHYFFSQVIEGFIERAEQEGYLVIILQSNEKLSLEKQQVNLLIEQRVDGILISLSNLTNQFVHLQKILSAGIPLVLFDKVEQSIECSKVRIDDFEAAYKAVSYLISKGHQRIAHFRGEFSPKNSTYRFEGYKQALIDNHIEFDTSLVYHCDSNRSYKGGYTNAKKAILEHPNLDAIFSSTDLAAIGIIKCFNELQIKIPDDIAVFGFSNWFMSSAITPALSTVNQPAYEMGITAMEILLNEIKCIKSGNSVIFKDVILPTKLILRDSS
ncbi:LacI family DNA-binding transcriptional regulator [Ascidiimonas sp. W6]|uniref:LacI family DNA-binding transcriptional regulator n=1 Tax=Ascidiimonas meishanensis TaxID=3128903 RepID=UPI0030EF46B3